MTVDRPGLFDGVLAAGPVRGEVGDRAWLRAMLDVESALAAAGADAGLIERAHADRIAEVCRIGNWTTEDLAVLGEQAAGTGNPAAPLVRMITRRAGEAGRFVHLGATSQDIVDSAAMLLFTRARTLLLADLDACAEAAATLAEAHATTVQSGRTLGQQALPVTFGLVAAGWLGALERAAAGLREPRPAVQLGGATGTLASLGVEGPVVLAALSRRLGLAEPVLPWHTERTRITELAGKLGTAAGAVSGIARTITLLAQTEVGEVTEQGPSGSGGSSTMPHKRNPVAAVAAVACARQAPGLVATLLAAAEQEHQRAAGAWHAEWRPFSELLRSTGSAVHWLSRSLHRLDVDPARMRRNLEATGGLMLAERITTELAPVVGRLTAHDAVTACCSRVAEGEGELTELLAADPVVGAELSRERIAELLDPADYLGSAGEFVGRAVGQYRNRRENR
ncbi:3-carboxy-cis,cis-muconate cycloisomerase [Amycolatopsis marina]|uniref:3-carboxy-cis,cis-muconate cycloisomerase n=1 Tax=Amycolatopsis marina TaxID=490629 RepID=A0A1I0WQ04_9PSEU|nr:lyase family protein [Amycolatopsis marina]SFA90842.1 3-carboxy-cis,cis-muconate cycloisomerase [Amycolatopsis marina]